MFLKRKISECSFVALDLETTGVNPAFHEIVEVGMIKFNLQREISRYEELINPNTKIPEDVIRIHGITDEMVKDSKIIYDVLPEIGKFIQDSILIVQNPAFDLSFLERNFLRYNMPVPSMKAFDTVTMAKLAYPELPNHKLNTVAEYLGVQFKHHRAVTDAHACMRIFTSIVDILDKDSDLLISDLIAFHGNFIRAKKIRKVTVNKKILKDIIIGKTVRIKYRDTKGNETIRKILPKEIVHYGNKSYIAAHCYLRDEQRYFNTRNIKILEK